MLIFALAVCVFGVLYAKNVFKEIFFPLMFSSRSVMGLGLTFKSLIHFELIFFLSGIRQLSR